MKVIYSPHHILHNPPKEFISNNVTDYGESPERAEIIYEAMFDVPGLELMRASVFGMEHIAKAHAPDYVNYLQSAYNEWIEAGLWSEGILPEFFALGRIRNNLISKSPVGKAGYYMTDSCTMIVRGTWEAVRYSAFTALTGARYILDGEPFVFSICRPPGHHAGYDFAGGYCFLNNAAIAARFLQDSGEASQKGDKKVAILDIDFHHGNGTQDIVTRFDDVLFISIHGDPHISYPYLTGFTSENSSRIINFPLPPGTPDEAYFAVFTEAVDRIRTFGAEYLIVSLGVDTHEQDQLGNFKLSSSIYSRLSSYLKREMRLPVLILMEGGYNSSSLADNVLSFLGPFFR